MRPAPAKSVAAYVRPLIRCAVTLMAACKAHEISNMAYCFQHMTCYHLYLSLITYVGSNVSGKDCTSYIIHTYLVLTYITYLQL